MNYSISVLIPVYNVEDYIEKCAESLFNNTIAEKCEFIFTNDCTTDTSMKVLNSVIEKYPKLKNNIVLLHHDKNMGLGTTRNTGFDATNGKYIICVDSDDWVETNYLEELLTLAEKDDLDFIGCDAFFEKEETNETKIRHYPLDSDPKKCLIDIYDYKVGDYLWIKMMKKEFLIKNNIRWADGINIHEDLLLDTKVLSKNPKIGYINKPLYHYLLRKGSYMHTLYTEKKADENFKAILLIDNYLKTNKIDFAYEAFKTRSYKIKCNCISHGTLFSQKKYLNLYKDLNKYATLKNTKQFYYFVIKISNKLPRLAFFIVYCFSILKCLLHKIDYNEYISS